jgi:phosphopantothenoylcysteine decarboxylase/phosphopantothenate--cysteine ligase
VKDGVVVGFAAETEDIEANARVKLERKGCDFVVANQVGPAQGFGPGETEVLLVQEDAETLPFGPASKSKVAGFVLNQVVKLLDRKGNP